MFRGEQCRMKLRFENSLAGVVLDRFGRDRLLVPDGPDHFVFQADISVSPTFLGWLAGFGGRAEIVFPASAAEAYRDFSAPCAFRSRVRQNGNDLFSKYS